MATGSLRRVSLGSEIPLMIGITKERENIEFININ